jgi:hypothetical protein
MQFLTFLGLWKILLASIANFGNLLIFSVLEIRNKYTDLLKYAYFGLCKSFAIFFSLLVFLRLNELLKPLLLLQLFSDWTFRVFFNLSQNFLLSQVVLPEHVVVQSGTVVLCGGVYAFFVLWRFSDAVAVGV